MCAPARAASRSRYGPFERQGSRVIDDEAALDDEVYFDLGSNKNQDDDGWAEWLGDLDGDGVGEVAIGHSKDGVSGSISMIVSVGDRRGESVSWRDAPYLLTDAEEIRGFGDLTGDGITDFGDWMGGTLCDGSVARGIVGKLADLPGCTADGTHREPVGDVDGDGLTDILVYMPDDRNSLNENRLLPGRMFADGLPVSAAIELAGIRAARTPWMGVDVTGDGLSDVVLGDLYWQGDTGVETGRIVVFASEDLGPRLGAVTLP